MLALVVRIVDRAPESFVDRMAIRLFFFIAKYASRRMLVIFRGELDAEIRDRYEATRRAEPVA